MNDSWRLMYNTNVFINYDAQSGPRGVDQFNSVNWVTFNAQRAVGDHEIAFRTTLSLDVETTGGGTPMLFQTGETYRGATLVGRNDARDFFMELATRYRRNLGDDTAAFVYLAAAGSPALGPTSFTHRASSMANPAAPASQQWLDSTHNSFGVATLGLSQGKWQFEASCFNGRETAGDGWGLNMATLDSASGRISFNPTKNWSFQVSSAFLDSPEAFDRSASQHRTTASIQHHRGLTGSASIATTLALGRNTFGEQQSDAMLLETSWDTGRGCTLFGRAEYVEKLGRQLAVADGETKFPLKTLTLGASHDFTPGRPFSVAVGGALTYTLIPRGLDAFYGDHPVGLLLFVRVIPGRKVYAAID